LSKKDLLSIQEKNADLWNTVHKYHEGNRYPHEYLVKFSSFIEQAKYISSLSALDIGFGCHSNLKMCYEMGYDIYGIEVSGEALRKTSQTFEDMGIKFTGKLFNSPEIPFEDNKFSLVYSQQAIYYNLDLEKVISEIKRVLVPGGAIYITFFTPKHWYFRHSEKVNDTLVKWSDAFPTLALRGLILRYFSSKQELREIFNEFKYLRVDDFNTNMLGVDFSLWIVTGFKDGEFLKQFNMMEHYENVAKPK